MGWDVMAPRAHISGCVESENWPCVRTLLGNDMWRGKGLLSVLLSGGAGTPLAHLTDLVMNIASYFL